MRDEHRRHRGPASTTLRLLVVLVLALAAVTVAAPSSASAAAPCWKRLLNDWYDGRIDKAYPVKCYREAIRNLPEDVEAYSSAHDDLTRALLSAARQSGGKLGPNDLVPAGAAGRRSVPEAGEEDSLAGGVLGGDDGDGPLGFFAPSNADSIPIPLLVLAGLALLLLAAAGASFLARRIQARRAGPAASDR
jgi:hypothetical protein